jgi:riboflavin biosynthesis pyrimidine reductase
MSPEPEPSALTPLSGATARLTAAQIVERLRPWDSGPATDPSPPSRRPRVFLNMVCTADGRATLGGRSGPIGNRADRELFHALRTAVDAVMVGAGTVRAERYRRLVREDAHRQLRRERGMEEEPLACIVSASLDLSPEIPLLADPAARIAILTPSPTGVLPASATPDRRANPIEPARATPDRRTDPVEPARARPDLRTDPMEPARTTPDLRTDPVEYVRAAHEGRLDLPGALAELHARLGVATVLCEGGPHLNGELLAAGLVDELFLSLAPKLGGGGDAPAGGAASGPGSGAEPLRIVRGPEFDPPIELELLGALESESQLLLRYRVGGAG